MARGLITDEEKQRVSEYNKRYYQLHKQRLKEKRDSEPEYLKERRKLRMLMTTCLRYRLDNDYRRERKAYQRTRYRRKKRAKKRDTAPDVMQKKQDLSTSFRRKIR